MSGPSAKRPRKAPVPRVTERALENEVVSKTIGEMRVLGIRGPLRPPDPERPICQSMDFEQAVLQAMLRSPHSIQASEEDFKELLHLHGELPRVLTEDAPRRPYRERRDKLKTVVHWGQRKLLLSEIEFLTIHSSGCTRVIYAGAAPGTHIPFLASLFPHLSFVLVDPGEFRVKSSEKPQIEVRNEFFTREMAKELRESETAGSPTTLFISDIRTGDPKIHCKEDVERFVSQDMAMQQEWLRDLAPRMAMLKFRLPWTPGRTTYLDGRIHLPVWGPPTTTETRLITNGATTKDYDNTAYEEQMFYFNNVTRVRRFRTPVVGEGLCESYDSVAEVQILQAYLASLSNSDRATVQHMLGVQPDDCAAQGGVDPTLVALFRRLSPASSVRGAKGRHLLTVLPTGAREKWYNAKVFDAKIGKYLDASTQEGQELLCAQHTCAADVAVNE